MKEENHEREDRDPRDEDPNPQAALLVLVSGLVAFVAVLTLLSRVTPDTKVPVRPPGVATTVASAPGAAIKAVANDPYLRVRPSQSSTRVAGVEATKASLQEPGFGPNFNIGRACPKCW